MTFHFVYYISKSIRESELITVCFQIKNQSEYGIDSIEFDFEYRTRAMANRGYNLFFLSFCNETLAQK